MSFQNSTWLTGGLSPSQKSSLQTVIANWLGVFLSSMHATCGCFSLVILKDLSFGKICAVNPSCFSIIRGFFIIIHFVFKTFLQEVVSVKIIFSSEAVIALFLQRLIL